jgi:hypothetical protein
MQSKSELQHLADKYGWKVKPLSYAEVRAMSSQEYEYHEKFNAKALEAALNEHATKGIIEKGEALSRLQQVAAAFRSGLGMDSDTLELFMAAAQEFERRHPYLDFSPDNTVNGTILGGYMVNNGLDPTKIESFETAYRALGGKSAFRLSAAAQQAEDEKRMGAAEYGRKHGIVGGDARQRDFRATDDSRFYNPLTRQVETRVRANPQMMAARDRNIATFISVIPDYARTDKNRDNMLRELSGMVVNDGESDGAPGADWTVQNLKLAWERMKAKGIAEVLPPHQQSQQHGQVVTGTDMKGQHSGTDHIPYTDKWSFHNLVRNMDSKTYAERLRTDRQFREAIDRWGER